MIARLNKCFGIQVTATIAVVLLLPAGQTAFADVLTWNIAGSSAPADGSGTWGTGSNWWNGSGNVAWANGNNDTALFGAAAGTTARTVSLNRSQSVGGIVFQSQAYTLGDSSGALNLAGSAPTVTVNACGGTIGAVLTGSAGMTKAGSGMLTLTASNAYTGTTTVNGGTLQLTVANQKCGGLVSPTIAVNSSGFLALNAQDALGYTSGNEALVINGGTVSNITAGGRITLQNPVTMTGGLLTGSGTGDCGGVYSFNFAGVIATSDSGGNPAIISASSISAENNDLSFNIARGAAAPVSDLTVVSSIVPYNGRTNGIAKTGNGILTLTASNTYVGPTSVSSGTLLLGNGGTTGSLLPSGSISINSNATLAFCRSDTVVQGTDFSSGGISGAGSLVQLGTGLLVLNAANTYTGPTVVAGGTLSANLLAEGGAASAIGRSSDDSSNLVVKNGGVFQYTGSSVSIGRGFAVGTGGGGIDVAGGTTLQLSNSAVLQGTLTKTGAGTLRLTSYTGSSVTGGGMLVINQGTVDFGDSYFGRTPFGDRALNIQVNPGGDLCISGKHALGGGTADTNTSWGTVTVLGGTMSLSAEQYITGGTVNSPGRLVLQGATVNDAGGGELRATANTSCISTLASAQPSTINVALTAQYGPYAFNVADGPADADLLIAGNLSSSSSLYGIAKLNAGKLVLTGSNSYAATTIDGGTLQIGDGGNGGTLGTGPVADNAVLSFARSDGITVANAISGSGMLVQLGPGALTLMGANTYWGGTAVSGGTLVLASAAAIEDGSSLTVGDPAEFQPGPSVPATDFQAEPPLAAVPEPGTWRLFAAALAVAVIYYRRARSPSGT